MKTILLTSAGMEMTDEILNLLTKPINETKMAYIITASQGEGGYDEKKDDDIKIIKDLGFQVFSYDIAGKKERDLSDFFDGKDMIYVQGGNTFYLLKYIKESGFDKVINEYIDQGVIYVGVSAGSIVAGPTIEVAGWKNIDRNEVGLTDLDALKFVDFNIFVHYEPKYEELVREEIPRSNFQTRILTDKQAFLVKDDAVYFLGKGEEMRL